MRVPKGKRVKRTLNILSREIGGRSDEIESKVRRPASCERKGFKREERRAKRTKVRVLAE